VGISFGVNRVSGKKVISIEEKTEKKSFWILVGGKLRFDSIEKKLREIVDHCLVVSIEWGGGEGYSAIRDCPKGKRGGERSAFWARREKVDFLQSWSKLKNHEIQVTEKEFFSQSRTEGLCG